MYNYSVLLGARINQIITEVTDTSSDLLIKITGLGLLSVSEDLSCVFNTDYFLTSQAETQPWVSKRKFTVYDFNLILNVASVFGISSVSPTDPPCSQIP